MSLKRRNKPSVEFSFASAADMVFLLLLYFLLTSTFVTQSSLDVQLPTSASDKPSPEGNYVTITKDGIYSWKTTGISEKTLTEREELRPLIREVLQDSDPNNNTVTLRIDKRVLFDDAAFVMAIVAEYEGQIVIMTEKE